MLGLAEAADRNLSGAWSLLGRAAGFAVTRVGTVTIASSGLPIAFFNGAFSAGVANDPEMTVRDTVAFYIERNVPFLLWARTDEALLQAGRAAGLRDAGGPPLMILPVIEAIPEPPKGLTIRIASTVGDLLDHGNVVAGGFGMAIDVARAILGEGLLADPDVAIAIGYVQDMPVTTALLARTGDTAGVYNVATLPDHRGSGFGEAATWAVIAEGAHRGCNHSVLQSSDAGYPVYKRMGFVDVGRYVQLEGPP